MYTRTPCHRPFPTPGGKSFLLSTIESLLSIREHSSVWRVLSYYDLLMSNLILGIVAAVGAATLYSLGFAFQAMDAKQTSHEEHLRLALARSLIRRSRWLLGTSISVLGWPLQITAVLLAPLIVVQPTLAIGLLVLLFLAERMLGEHAGHYEYFAMLAIIAGIVGVGLSAPPLRTSYTTEEMPVAIAMVSLGALSLLPYLLRALGRRSPALMTMIGAGLALAWCGVAAKLAADDLSQGHLALAAAWGVGAGLAAGVGALSEMSALQSRPAIQVAPLSIVTQTLIPVALAPMLFGEHFRATPFHGLTLLVSLLVLLLGAALLARSPLLLALVEGQRSHPHPSD